MSQATRPDGRGSSTIVGSLYPHQIPQVPISGPTRCARPCTRNPDRLIAVFVVDVPRRVSHQHAVGDGLRSRLGRGTDRRSLGVPGCDRIVFARERPYSGIWTMEQTGEHLTRLTHEADFHPQWSPDGTRIVSNDSLQ